MQLLCNVPDLLAPDVYIDVWPGPARLQYYYCTYIYIEMEDMPPSAAKRIIITHSGSGINYYMRIYISFDLT